jgi:hypothetical protein
MAVISLWLEFVGLLKIVNGLLGASKFLTRVREHAENCVVVLRFKKQKDGVNRGHGPVSREIAIFEEPPEFAEVIHGQFSFS